MKNSFRFSLYGSFLCAMFLFFNACSTSDTGDIASITRERDSLRSVISSLLSADTASLTDKHAVGSADEATGMIEKFRGAKKIIIPRAVLFSRASIQSLLEDDESKYVRFYFGIQDAVASRLTLLGVGVGDDNKDRVSLGSGTGIIEFADPCPPCAIGSAAAVHDPSANPVLCPDPTGLHEIGFTR